MDVAFNEKCADEAMRRSELLAAAKGAVFALDAFVFLHKQRGDDVAAKITEEFKERLEAAIKAEEGAK